MSQLLLSILIPYRSTTVPQVSFVLFENEASFYLES